jgi:hypothetical protein
VRSTGDNQVVFCSGLAGSKLSKIVWISRLRGKEDHQVSLKKKKINEFE